MCIGPRVLGLSGAMPHRGAGRPQRHRAVTRSDAVSNETGAHQGVAEASSGPLCAVAHRAGGRRSHLPVESAAGIWRISGGGVPDDGDLIRDHVD